MFMLSQATQPLNQAWENYISSNVQASSVWITPFQNRLYVCRRGAGVGGVITLNKISQTQTNTEWFLLMQNLGFETTYA